MTDRTEVYEDKAGQWRVAAHSGEQRDHRQLRGVVRRHGRFWHRTLPEPEAEG